MNLASYTSVLYSLLSIVIVGGTKCSGFTYRYVIFFSTPKRIDNMSVRTLLTSLYPKLTARELYFLLL